MSWMNHEEHEVFSNDFSFVVFVSFVVI